MSAGVPPNQDSNTANTRNIKINNNTDNILICELFHKSINGTLYQLSNYVVLPPNNKEAHTMTNEYYKNVILCDYNGILIAEFPNTCYDLKFPDRYVFITSYKAAIGKTVIMVEYILVDGSYEQNIISEFNMGDDAVSLNVRRFCDYASPNCPYNGMAWMTRGNPHSPSSTNTMVTYNKEGFGKSVTVTGCVLPITSYGISMPYTKMRPFFIWVVSNEHPTPRCTCIYDSNLNQILKLDCDSIEVERYYSSYDLPINKAFIKTDKGEFYKIAPYKIPEEELCVECKKQRMTSNKVLSCGHRNYCDGCITDLQVCGICKDDKAISVITLR